MHLRFEKVAQAGNLTYKIAQINTSYLKTVLCTLSAITKGIAYFKNATYKMPLERQFICKI